MKTRPATADDETLLRELWQEFETEVPDPGFAPETWEQNWATLSGAIGAGLLFLAEDDGGAIGFADALVEGPRSARLHTVYVRARARRSGVAKALLAEVTAAARKGGATDLTLEVLESNALAREIWTRLGFAPLAHILVEPLDELDARLAAPPEGPSHASTHVQTDDRASVERAVAQFVPRLHGTEVRDAADGWIRITDPQLDSDRNAHSRLANDLSDRLGAVVVALAVEHGSVVRFRLYERGRMMDEYLSVPTFYGPISKGDELALEANPTLVARLTGASHDEVRHVARTAAAPGDLPPAEELYAQIARLMRLEA